ncbi:MAG: hypothetical protein ACRDFB_02160, partial [Rhabdochlamydiaceae bacterium]
WSPWVQHKRRMSVPAYEKLLSVENQVIEFAIDGQEDSKKIVFYQSKAYDYDFFIKWYVENGRDPLTRQPIDLSKLYRFSKTGMFELEAV